MCRGWGVQHRRASVQSPCRVRSIKGSRGGAVATALAQTLPADALPDPTFLVNPPAAGADISPWHDIPLQGKDGTYNFVCEIPKETAAKMEVATVRTRREEVSYVWMRNARMVLTTSCAKILTESVAKWRSPR